MLTAMTKKLTFDDRVISSSFLLSEFSVCAIDNIKKINKILTVMPYLSRNFTVTIAVVSRHC